MKKWEDIVKDKLESYEYALPESAFAAFQALREGGAPAARRRSPVWLLIPVLAACPVAILILFHPGNVPDDQPLQEMQTDPVVLVADAADTTDVGEVLSSPIVAQKRPLSYPSAEVAHEPAPPEERKPTTPAQTETEAVEVASPAPFLPPESKMREPVKMKVGTAAGIIVGGGLVAAVATPFLFARSSMDRGPVGSAGLQPENDIHMNSSHSFPFKGGLSVGIPVANRLRITTGLEYSMYHSRFTYSESGDRNQFVHYLGIPVRLDWIWAENRWLQAYLGGGFEGEVCLGATCGGERLKPDGPGFSLLAAGGVQLNFSRRIGLFLEPQLSWTVPSEGHTLQTYRSILPVTFTVSTGLRINFGH